MQSKLVQFQCEREGTLFYYQNAEHGRTLDVTKMVEYCPLCGSKRVSATGRTYAMVEEGYRIVA